MSKTNRFHVKKIDKNKITIEEERKNRSPLVLFFINNGKLIFWISLLFSITVFIIAIYFTLFNIGDSSIVEYESKGVVVTFEGTDNSILNGTPITSEYANKLFDNYITINSSDIGVVIKLKEVILEDQVIVYYSDNTALIKYNNGKYLRVFSVNNKYGVDESGIIDSKAVTKNVTVTNNYNNKLGISIIYLSDNSLEITKGNTTFFVRNNDIFNNDNVFYTNLSGVSLVYKEENGNKYFSDGTVKTNDYIVINNNKYSKKEEKHIFENIRIIYYENGYAEIIKDDLNIIVKNSEHIIYSDNSLEIIDNSVNISKIQDIMDMKEITLNNTNIEDAHYIIVLEETNNYKKHGVTKRLDNEFIRFNILINDNKLENTILNNNIKNNILLEGLSIDNNTYLLYEGDIKGLSQIPIKIGLWIDYEKITNDFMASTFIGTIKVYVESIK